MHIQKYKNLIRKTYRPNCILEARLHNKNRHEFNGGLNSQSKTDPKNRTLATETMHRDIPEILKCTKLATCAIIFVSLNSETI